MRNRVILSLALATGAAGAAAPPAPFAAADVDEARLVAAGQPHPPG